MLVKVFARGSSADKAGRGPIDYALGDRNHEHELRDHPAELLRGDPEITNAVIEGLPFAQRYTSGVLSFAPEETGKLDDETKQELMDGFESMVAPGMEQDRLSWVWIQHQDHARTELHWVVANVDLKTHKRFAPYYDRADRSRFAAWQQYQNQSRGLADPQDPQRRRASVHNCRLPVEKRNDAAALEEHIQRRCASGNLRDRAAIVQYLTGELGLKVPRQGKDYITVQYGEAKNERFRLKGAIFHETYRFERDLAAERGGAGSPGAGRRGPSVSELRDQLEKLTERRREYLAGRYCRPQIRAPEPAGRAAETDPQRHAAAPVPAENPATGDRVVVPGADRSDVAVDATGAVERAHVPGANERPPDVSRHRRSGLENLHDEQRPGASVQDPRTGETPRCGPESRAGNPTQAEESLTETAGADPSGSGVRAGLERSENGTTERTGEFATGLVEAIERGIRAARETHDRAVQRVRGVLRGAVERTKGAVRRGLEALGRLDAANREIDGATGHLASLVAEKVARDAPWERGRESGWSR